MYQFISFIKFQSLSGITECSLAGIASDGKLYIKVSIPFRDYGVFSKPPLLSNEEVGQCFNPFQGLRSVLNKNAPSSTQGNRAVSIPFRDYGVFSPALVAGFPGPRPVSIPFRDYGVFS